MHFAQRRARADRRGDGLRLEPLLDVVAAPQFADQHGRDHLPAVGDGVVERDHLDRRQPHAVAVAHLDEHDARVGYFPVGSDRRGAFAEPFQPDSLAQVELLVQEVAVFLLLARDAVAIPDRLGEIDVRRRGYGAAEVYDVVAPVRVADIPGRADRHGVAVVRVVGRLGRHAGVVEQREHRRQLEGRSGLHAASQRIVLPFVIAAARGSRAAQVGHGEDLAGLHLHDDGRAPDGVLGFQLAPQRLVGHVLQVEVECRHDVVSVHRVFMPGSRHAAVEAPGDTLPQRLAVPSREFLAVGLLDAVIALVAREPDRTARQFALRVDALVAFDEAVDHAHVPVQHRVTPQGLPFGIVHLAGKDVDGGVVADRVVDFPGDVLLAPQAIHHARQPPFGAQVGGVAAVAQPVAAGVLLAEAAGVFRGGFVLEEGGEQLGERVALFAESLERIEAGRSEVEGRLVAEDRGRQRRPVAREDAAPLGRDGLFGEDAAGRRCRPLRR